MPEPDSLFPRLHARPATGWVNDPNGIGFWDGCWHVMCQYNPRAAVWGDIEWAHLTSTDLVTWRQEPAALVPRPGTIDAWGAWSGVAWPVDGDVALVYTAIPEGGASLATVAVARRGEDGGWVQPDRGVTPAAPAGIVDVRDPYLLEWQGRRLAVQGAGTADGVPLVMLYDATDIDAWRPLGVLLRGDDPIAARHAPGRLWECPQLVPFEDSWVLVLSLWDDTAPGAAGHGPQRVAWLAGDLVAAGDAAGSETGDGVRFVPREGGSLDDGDAFYAPQVVRDPADGRVLAWGWVWEGSRSAPPPGVPERDWAGALTFPRELTRGPDGVTSAFAREVAAAFATPEPHEGALPREPWYAVVHHAHEASIALTRRTFDGASRTVWTGAGRDGVVTFDGSILEAIVDGRATTHRIYPEPGDVLVLTATDASGAAVEILVATPRPSPRSMPASTDTDPSAP